MQHDTTTGAPSKRAGRAAEAALWASAFVLAGLVVWRAGAPEAKAEMVTQVGQYAALTTRAVNAEVLAVVDNASEQVMVYTIEPGNRFELRARESLRDMFAQARARAIGRP
jgi:uncharacterized membrane protein